MDPHSLSLEDPLRLRVGSAQAYSIVRSRDCKHFETVMDFLETTYRLLPRLVSPIKHMKIMFGLKTMLIMKMLKKRSGLVDTMFKINQLFPSKLPQYQHHCSQHQMFLMKKNHLDFKAFVQVLALQKDKLEDYVENQMEDQYGELYAQKVEERLLHYLLRLEAVLPGDTCADQILNKGSPMTEEERTLVEVVTSDSTVIVETLKKLLNCGAVSAYPGGASELLQSEKVRPPNLKSASQSSSSSSGSLLVSVEAKRRRSETDPDVSEDDLEEENSDSGKTGTSQSSSEDVQRAAAASPQFCSKHRRWVNSILQECPAEGSDELQRQANVSASPPLFPSSSGSSSDDLTPSNLQPPASHSSINLQMSGRVSPDKLESGRSGSGSNASESEPPHQLRDALQPGVLFPVVPLIDIASVDKFSSVFRCQQASPAASTSACRSSPQRSSSGVLKRSRPGSQALGRVRSSCSLSQTKSNISGPAKRDASTSTTQPGRLKTETSSQCGTSQNLEPLPHPHETSRDQRAQLKLSLCCQAMLLQSKLLQPCVSLVRLRETGRGSSTGHVEPAEEEGEDPDSSFDVNVLYSSSSDGESKDSLLSDPHYKPSIPRKRLLMEYEAARSVNNI